MIYNYLKPLIYNVTDRKTFCLDREKNGKDKKQLLCHKW